MAVSACMASMAASSCIRPSSSSNRPSCTSTPARPPARPPAHIQCRISSSSSCLPCRHTARARSGPQQSAASLCGPHKDRRRTHARTHVRPSASTQPMAHSEARQPAHAGTGLPDEDVGGAVDEAGCVVVRRHPPPAPARLGAGPASVESRTCPPAAPAKVIYV